MYNASRRARRLHALGIAVVAMLAGACASTPVQRRAALISDADKEAKAALANESRIDAGKIPPRTFAVTPFFVADRDTLLKPLGFGLADLLITDLSRTPELKLVERVRTDAMLRELALIDSGAIDPRGAPRVGRLVGARRLLIGSASRPTPNTVRLQARVVDAIAGTVEELTTADAPIDRVMDAEKALAILILQRMGITLTPAQRNAIEQRQAVDVTALVAYGRGVQAEARGDAAGASAAFEEASRLDAAFMASRPGVTAGGGTVASSQRSSSVQRVLDISTSAINTPVIAKPPEAVDAPLAASSSVVLTLTIRVTP